MDLLKSTNPIIDWAACSLELTVGNILLAVLAFPISSDAYVTLSSLKLMLTEVKHGFPAWFGFLYPHSLLETK